MSTKTPTLIIHRLFAIAITAEAASHQIREVLPKWQPELDRGFQGRQVMVIRESQEVYNGHLSERQLVVVASGHDGHVREYFAWHRQAAEAGRISYGNPTRPATTAEFDAVEDVCLANAMPASFLKGIETSLDFHVRNHKLLLGWQQQKLKVYQEAGIAPTDPRTDARTGATIWPINFSLLPEESMYAMLELHGRQFTDIFKVRATKEGQGGLEFLASAHQHWRQEFRKAA